MTPAAPPPARQVAGLAAAVVAWLAATAWARPLMLPDEGRYVGVAWEMLRSGDWLTPTLNGLPYFHKPPLFYWITAASLSLFGLNEAAARAAPVLGATLGAMATYLFARRWWDERAARLTLVALLVQPLFFLAGQFANLDMLVAGCITATIVALADAALCIEGGHAYRKALAVAYGMAALGVLAKGMIGWVIPALVIGVWVLLRRRRRVLPALVWWPGVALFVVIAAPWFVAMQARFPAFLDYFFVVQHFKRFTAGGFNNVQPFWFFPAVLLLCSLPWLPWLVVPLRRGFSFGAAEGSSERTPLRLLWAAWVMTVVAFFSLPQSKLVGYVLPAVPPLALWMADGFLMSRASPQRARGGWLASLTVTAMVSLGAVVVIALHPGLPSSRDFGAVLRQFDAAPDSVLMLGHYAFDLPFYARLGGPVGVVDDWADPAIGQRDNWRKELADAARFAPVLAESSLIAPSEVGARLCARPVSWVIGRSDAAVRYEGLTMGQALLVRGDLTLWRVDRSRAAVPLRCPAPADAGPAVPQASRPAP